MASRKLNLPAILDKEIPDLAIPEPIPGSEFMRGTHIECISNKDVEEELTIGVVYKIEDLAPDDGVSVMNDLGNYHNYYNWHFKSIQHGPFKKDDEVSLNAGEDVEVVTKRQGDSDNDQALIGNFLGSRYIVTVATDTYVHIKVRDGIVFKVPNRNLRFYRRNKMLKKNPFKVNDRVKCVKSHNSLTLGCIYTISHLDGDSVFLKEYQDVERFRYNLFLKWDRPTKVQIRMKKHKAKMKLADHVRYYVNRKGADKKSLLKIRNEMLDDKIISEDVSLKDIKQICDTMFSWK